MTDDKHTITIYYVECPVCKRLFYSFDKFQVATDIFFHMTTHVKDLKQIRVPKVDEYSLTIT